MTSENLILEKHLKKTTILSNLFSVVVAIVTALIVVNSFYYKTTNTMEQHSTEIREVKQDVTVIKEQIKESAVYQGVSNAEINAMKEKIMSLENKMDKMNDKLDKILLQTR